MASASSVTRSAQAFVWRWIQLFTVLGRKRRELKREDSYARFVRPSLDAVHGLTMVGPASLTSLGVHVLKVLEEDVPGDLVECGVWMGGSSFLMADLLRRKHAARRKVWMFDSFEGLPPPSDLDGSEAKSYAEDTESPIYWDNCEASLDDVEKNAQRLGLLDRVVMVKGWFDQTLPKERSRIGPISILRLDGDWYDSIKTSLVNLYDQVSPGGYIFLDDYYRWEGCAKAVHDFLSERKLSDRVVTIFHELGGPESAYIRKSS